jgi:hypothetical protein
MNNPANIQTDITAPFKLTPAAVAAWIDELPVLNTVQTAEKLYRALSTLKQLDINPMLRFQLIEHMKNTIYLLSKGLEKYFIDVSFPLQKKELKLSKLSTHLHRELVSNYTLLTKDNTFLNSGPFSSSQKEIIIERALCSLALEQLMIFQRYEACSTRFWSQLYGLITLAEQLGLLPTTKENSPLEIIIKRILLFSLSAPNRFSQRDITALYALLEERAEWAQLGSQSGDSQEEKSGFFIELNSPLAPQHTSRLETLTPTLRYLHTNSLIKQLISQFRLLVNTQYKNHIAPNQQMLAKVIRSLSTPEHRKYKRLNSQPAECSAILGLNNIVEYLSDASASRSKKVTKKMKTVRASELWDDIPDFGILPIDANGSNTLTFGSSHRNEGLAYTQLSNSKSQVPSSDIWNKTGSNITPIKISAFGCKIIDISQKGLQLLWTKEDTAKIKVGGIIAIFQDNIPVKSGIIRRVAQDEKGELSFGVELLSPVVQLVTISSPKQPDSEIKGLLIPEQLKENIQQSLLIPPSKYQTGGWVDIKEKETPQRYRFQKLLEASPSFEQFSLFKLDN